MLQKCRLIAHIFSEPIAIDPKTVTSPHFDHFICETFLPDAEPDQHVQGVFGWDFHFRLVASKATRLTGTRKPAEILVMIGKLL